MIAIILFLVDFLFFAIFDCFLIRSLVFYLVYVLLEQKKVTVFHLAGMCFLILLQDSVIFTQYGLSLLYLVPLIILGHAIRHVFVAGSLIPHFILCAVFVGGHMVLLFMQEKGGWHSTGWLILSNIIVILILLKMRTWVGVLGNRFPFRRRRGKSGLPTGTVP